MIIHLTDHTSMDVERGYRCTYFRGPETRCDAHDHTFYELVIAGKQKESDAL